MELREEEITTYTYTVDKDGQLHFVCQSVGYGLPYSTQMTSPTTTEERYDHKSVSTTQSPQPEPNGLYMPDNVSAIWILCLGDDGELAPIYSEPKLMVSPFKLDGKDRYRK